MPIQLREQIVAKEGVSAYPSQTGTPIMLGKRWENLSKFSGLTVPVTKLHSETVEPSASEIIGTAIFHKCGIGNNVLCADITIANDDLFNELETEYPGAQLGYSIGYFFNFDNATDLEKKRGADAAQIITDIGHVAVVPNPRDINALVVMDADNNKFMAMDFVGMIEMTEKKEEQKQTAKTNNGKDNAVNVGLDALTKRIKELEVLNKELIDFKTSTLKEKKVMALDSLSQVGLDPKRYESFSIDNIVKIASDVGKLIKEKDEPKTDAPQKVDAPLVNVGKDDLISLIEKMGLSFSKAQMPNQANKLPYSNIPTQKRRQIGGNE